MTITQIIDYDDSNNFNHDTSKVEVSGSLVRLILNTEITCAADYASSIDLTYGNGVLTGTATGGAGVSAGKLVLQGGAKYVTYDAVSNADSQQVGAVKFKFTPNYNGAPVSSLSLFSISEAHGNSNNLITVTHILGTGDIRVTMLDQAGATIFNYTSPSGWSPTLGQEYEFEFNWDVTTGVSRIFIDGNQFGATITGTGTRSSSIALFRIGAYYTGASITDGDYDDVMYFNVVQHIANYTPGYTIAKYPTDNPTVEIKVAHLADGLTSFVQTTAAEPSGTNLKYILVRSPDRWWNGAAWVTSAGTYAESNTAADINTNAGSLSIATGASFKLKAFLNSDGFDTPTLTTMTYEYDFYAASGSTNKCIVYGWVLDFEGAPVVGEEVTVFRGDPFHYDNNLIAVAASTVTDSNGYWELNLVETATDNKYVTFKFEYTSDGDPETRIFTPIQIPDTSSIDFETLSLGKEEALTAYKRLEDTSYTDGWVLPETP